MHKFDECTLAEALSAWGYDEVRGRWKSRIAPGLHTDDPLACIAIALQFRSMPIVRILASDPVITLRGLLAAKDLDALELADGGTLAEWAAGAAGGDDIAHEFVAGLSAAATPPAGALVLVAQLLAEEPEVVTGPKRLFDGRHRALAWQARARRGCDEDIPAYLILTRTDAPLPGPMA